MNFPSKRLIVVLGMHRSGTSAITRGLNVLDVELGDRLNPPEEGVNNKGFFEDLDILRLNESMLQTLGSDWHFLASIEPEDVITLKNMGFLLQAVDIIHKKTQVGSVFGFKDPRTVKLMPFWRQVFEHCGCGVGYVLVLRNPLSVAKSLEKRDGFSHEKSYMLWLGHVLTSLSNTEEHCRVLVDYDHFMHNPQKALELIAERLDLQINLQAFQTYLSEFLDEGLRHTIYSKNDLYIDHACPPLVQELYSSLLECSLDNSLLDKPDFRASTKQWVSEFVRLTSNLKWVDELLKQIATLNNSAVEHKKAFYQQLNEIEQVHEQQKNNFQRQYSERERNNYEQLNLVRQQLEIQLREMSEREKNYSQQLIETEQAHELQLSYQVRKQAEFEQKIQELFIQQQQQLECQLRVMSERENQYILQFQEIEQAHWMQICEQRRKYEENEQFLYSQLQVEREELHGLTIRWANVEKVQAQILTQLSLELNAIRCTYSWRWTTPFRGLASFFTKKDSNSTINFSRTVSLNETAEQVTHPSIHDNVENPSHELQQNTNKCISAPHIKNTITAALTLGELLSYDNESFIRCAYLTLLGREPDQEGLNYYLTRVQSNGNKEEIIAQISLSTEGKWREVKLDGLNRVIRRYSLLKMPIIGHLIRLLR